MSDVPNSLGLPAQLSLEELSHTNSEYDAEKIERYSALIKGGDAFRQNISKFLLQKAGETLENYQYRQRRAFYMPIGSGFISWILSAMFRQQVSISAPDDPTGYWEGLTTNCDNNQTDLQALFKSVAHETFVPGRGYFALNFANELGTDEQTKRAQFFSLSAKEVDAWEYGADGKLSWLRTAKCKRFRSRPFGDYDLESKIWSYYTPRETITYQYLDTPDAGRLRDSEKYAVATVRAHEFGCVPVFPVRCSDGQWIMEVIYDTLVALYNRQSTITSAVDILTLCTQVFKLLPTNGTDLSTVRTNVMNAIKLKVGEEFDFKSPDPNITNAAFKDEARVVSNLYACLQAFSFASAGQVQNPRQSASAKIIDRDPLDTFLAARVSPVVDAFEAGIAALKAYRDESDLDVQVTGISSFAANLDELKGFLANNSGTDEGNPVEPDESKDSEAAITASSTGDEQ